MQWASVIGRTAILPCDRGQEVIHTGIARRFCRARRARARQPRTTFYILLPILYFGRPLQSGHALLSTFFSLSSTTWMEFMECVCDFGGISGEIDLCCIDGGVSEEFLDCPEVCPVCEEMCCKRVSQQMWVDSFIDFRESSCLFNDSPQCPSVHLSSADAHHQIRASACPIQCRPSLFEIILHSPCGLCIEWDEPFLVPLSAHPHHPFGEVNCREL